MIRVPKNIVAIIPIFDPEGWGSEYAARQGTKAVLADGEVVEFQQRAVELYKPDGEKERSDQGIVKYVGEEAAKHGFLVGQYVLYSGYTGTLINLEGEGRLILMPFKFVQAELTEPENIEIPGLFVKTPTVCGMCDGMGSYYSTPLDMNIIPCGTCRGTRTVLVDAQAT
jgi:co-chaperonin GroES (HSP10)